MNDEKALDLLNRARKSISRIDSMAREILPNQCRPKGPTTSTFEAALVLSGWLEEAAALVKEIDGALADEEGE